MHLRQVWVAQFSNDLCQHPVAQRGVRIELNSLLSSEFTPERCCFFEILPGLLILTGQSAQEPPLHQRLAARPPRLPTQRHGPVQILQRT